MHYDFKVVSAMAKIHHGRKLFPHFNVNFCPAITGAALVDFEDAFPQIAQARLLLVFYSNKQGYIKTHTIRFVCTLLTIGPALINLCFASSARARIGGVWVAGSLR